MHVIRRSPGQAVRIGPYTLRVLAVRGDEVVVAVSDADAACAGCGDDCAERRRCAACAAETPVCDACAAGWRCPACGSPHRRRRNHS